MLKKNNKKRKANKKEWKNSTGSGTIRGKTRKGS